MSGFLKGDFGFDIRLAVVEQRENIVGQRVPDFGFGIVLLGSLFEHLGGFASAVRGSGSGRCPLPFQFVALYGLF